MRDFAVRIQSRKDNVEGDLNCDLKYLAAGLHNMLLTPHELILGHRLRLPTTVVYI
jgi:hypothetical protein